MRATKSQLRSKENTRQSLIVASIDVFVDKGIAGATVDDLTSAAGFTRGAFYSNFGSKEQVFWEAFSEVTRQAVASVSADIRVPPKVLDHDCATQDLFSTLDAMRPLGLRWYVLHTEAVSAALRDPEARTKLAHERRLLTSAVASTFETLPTMLPVRLRQPSSLIAETILSAYLNRMVSELVAGESNLEDTTQVIQGILDTFIESVEDQS